MVTMGDRRVLTEADHGRIAEAVRAAERRTSGEIYCVVARSSDSYFFPAAFMLAIGILVSSLGAALLLDAFWLAVRPSLFAAAQLLALAGAVLILRVFPAARIHFVPYRLRARRAHENAVKQFLARNVHITRARTGVLLFVSVAERHAEVIADAGINQHADQETWNGVVDTLTGHAQQGRIAEGLAVAVAEVGELLARPFPPEAHNPNELDDHVVEL